jgi:hypothetical protein
MSRKSGFEENFQEVLVEKNIKDHFNTIFQDMEKIREKCTDSKPLVDNINNNLLLLENKLIEIGLVINSTPTNTTTTFNPIMPNIPTPFNPMIKKSAIAKKIIKK